MKELLEVIIKGLVDNKDAVSIKEKQNKDTTVYQIKVNPADMGRIIGKQGKMAKSIRTLMKSVANKEHKRISVEFLD